MSKMTETVKNNRTDEKAVKMGKVMNFMGGNSYEINPLDTLKMVSASSIFGEPQYYRNGEQINGCQVEKWGGGVDWEFGMNMYTMLYLK